MSHPFAPPTFFLVNTFAHAALFEGCRYVWEPLSRLSSYLKEQKLGKIETDIPSSAYLVNPESISIGSGTIVEPGAYIQGPCIIGNNCHIRQGAYIRGELIAGEACVIGHATEMKHAILLDRSSAAHFNYVGDSILGNGVNLGAGAKCANFRLDHSPITVALEGKRWETGLKKLGAIVGDRAQLGCNSVTNPGTFIGQGATVYPCLSVRGYVPEGMKVKENYQTIQKGVGA